MCPTAINCTCSISALVLPQLPGLCSLINCPVLLPNSACSSLPHTTPKMRCTSPSSPRYLPVPSDITDPILRSECRRMRSTYGTFLGLHRLKPTVQLVSNLARLHEELCSASFNHTDLHSEPPLHTLQLATSSTNTTVHTIPTTNNGRSSHTDYQLHKFALYRVDCIHLSINVIKRVLDRRMRFMKWLQAHSLAVPLGVLSVNGIGAHGDWKPGRPSPT